MIFLQTPRQYYEQYLRPNQLDYLARADDARLGLNATISCWHLSDWVWRDREEYWSPFTACHEGSNPKERFQSYIKKQCPEMDVINNLANGTKHFLRRRDKDHFIERIPGISYGPGLDHPIGIAPLGVVGKEPDWLLVSVPDRFGKSSVGLVELLKRAVDWWPIFMDQHGL